MYLMGIRLVNNWSKLEPLRIRVANTRVRYPDDNIIVFKEDLVDNHAITS